MLNATTNLISTLLGDVFVNWISCEPVQVLIGLLCFGLVLKYVIRLFHI